MKTRKQAIGRRSGWLRFLGYGGSALLALAALAVLALPLLGEGGDAGASAGPDAAGAPRTSAAQGSGPQQPASDGPRRPAGQGGAGPGGQQDPLGQAGGTGQGDPLAPPGGAARDYCPKGLGAVRYDVNGLNVTVQMQGAAFVQVEVHLQGLTSLKQTTKVEGGRPHTFVFRQAGADRVERIQVRSMGTTVPQTCDLRLS